MRKNNFALIVLIISIFLTTSCVTFSIGTILTTKNGLVGDSLDKAYQGKNRYKLSPLINVDEALLGIIDLALIHLITNTKDITVDEAINELQILLVKIRKITAETYIRRSIAIADTHNDTIYITGRIYYEEGDDVYGVKISIQNWKNQDKFSSLREIKYQNDKVFLVRENIPEDEFKKKANNFYVKETEKFHILNTSPTR